MTIQIKADLSKTYSIAEFMTLDFSEVANAELLEGSVILTPPPGDEHGRVADEIRHRLSLFDPERKLGRVWINSRFQITEKSAFAPDLAFVLTSRVPPRTSGIVATRPDLVVEIVSPTDEPKDIKAKIEIYQQGEVPLIWLIYPAKKRVDVYRLSETVPQSLTEGFLSGENIISGFTLPIETLFED